MVSGLKHETSDTLPVFCSVKWSIPVSICSPLHMLNDHSLAACSQTHMLTPRQAPPFNAIIICPSK